MKHLAGTPRHLSRNMKMRFLPFLAIAVLLLLVGSCASKKGAVKDSALFDPEASLQEANELIKKRDFEKAREVLGEIKAKDASQKYAILATLRIADSYYDDELYEEAVSEYENFLNLHEQHKYASYAQYKLAMSYYKRIKTVDISQELAKKALREFETLQRRYPRNPYMEVTESRIKACQKVLAEYEFYVGEFYYKKGAYEAAANRFSEMMKNYPGSKRESEALFYLGVSYDRLGDREKAVNAFTRLIEKFPTIKLSSQAKKLLASIQNQQ